MMIIGRNEKQFLLLRAALGRVTSSSEVGQVLGVRAVANLALGDSRSALEDLSRAMMACDLVGWKAAFRLREAVRGLRHEAGAGMMTCLNRWSEI